MDRIDSIIRRIYDAALAPTEWEALLAEIASVIGAVAGFYAGLDVRHGRGAYWYTVGHDRGKSILSASSTAYQPSSKFAGISDISISHQPMPRNLKL